MKLLAKLLINSFALWIVAYLIPGFNFDSTQALIVTAVVIGVVNTFIKPILQIVALPITILTFGIAAILINVFLLQFVASIVPGFDITNFTTALYASILLSLVSWFLHSLASD